MKAKLILWLLLLAILPGVPALAQSLVSQQAHQILNNVLQRREFGSLQQAQAARPGWWNGFTKSVSSSWNKVTSSIGYQFSRFGYWWSQRFPQNSTKGDNFWSWWSDAIPAIRTTSLLLLILLAAALLGFIGYRIYLWSQARQVMTSLLGSGESVAGEKPASLPTDWEYALMQLEKMWNSGDQRGALRLLLRASMAILDIRGIMQYDESRANGEMLRDLRRRGRQDLSDLLRQVVRPCDRVWYGGFSIEGGEFHSAVAAGKRLRELLLTDKLL